MDADMMPMLCKSGSIPSVPEGDDWIMEPKIDGWRAITHVSNGQVFTYARSGAAYHGKCPHIDEALLALLPNDTVLDGEFAGPQGWGDVQGVMTRHENIGVELTYVVFDVMRVDGNDARGLTWDFRRELLEQIAFDGQVVLLNPYGPTDQVGADAMVAAGAEGVVCKKRSSRYTNSRSAVWLKYKPKLGTCEARITGFKSGKAGGKFDGMVGAFEVELLDNGATTTVKCGVDANHESATHEPEKWLHTIIEITHHGLGKTGTPRHPQFHRRRDDLAPEPVNSTKEVKKVSTTKGMTPREKQVAKALKESSRETQIERFQTGKNQATGRMRNYGAMGDAKLLKCIGELERGSGDAYNRALNASGNPEADLVNAQGVARQRGLL